jgi:hypothetical protein
MSPAVVVPTVLDGRKGPFGPAPDPARWSTLDPMHAGGLNGAVELDQNGLQVLDRDQCMRLLATTGFGRIAITSGALPAILPVNFRLFGDEILFRTARGTKLDAATKNAVVAFEVDAMDPLEHSGWSVMVTGVARQVADDELSPSVRARIPRWAPGGDSCVVAVSTEMVTGRRLT